MNFETLSEHCLWNWINATVTKLIWMNEGQKTQKKWQSPQRNPKVQMCAVFVALIVKFQWVISGERTSTFPLKIYFKIAQSRVDKIHLADLLKDGISSLVCVKYVQDLQCKYPVGVYQSSSELWKHRWGKPRREAFEPKMNIISPKRDIEKPCASSSLSAW